MLFVQALVDIIANYYKSLKENKEKKLLFFTFLAQYLGPDHEDISNSAEKVVELYKQVKLLKEITNRHHNILCYVLLYHIMNLQQFLSANPFRDEIILLF